MGITREQALDCLRSDDLIGIGMEADAVRRRLHPENVVTYAVSAQLEPGTHTLPEITACVAAARELGATGCELSAQPGTFAALDMAVTTVRKLVPEFWIAGPPASVLARLCESERLDRGEALLRLQRSGLDSIGAEPEQPDGSWLTVHQAAHRIRIRTVASISFGRGETLEQRVSVLQSIRDLQDQTGGFVAVAPISFHQPGGRVLDETTAVDYLKTLAVTRMYLENIEHVMGDGTRHGLKVLQMALRFGANDIGSIAVNQPGPGSEEELRRTIRDAGFRPVERDCGWRTLSIG